MSILVEPGSPHEARELLEASHALMESLFPSESNHYLSIEDLCVPEILFFVARSEGRVLGCGALAVKQGYGEVKSMFTDEAARGKGVADSVLSALTNAARDAGLPCIRLETGDSLKVDGWPDRLSDI